MVKLKYYQKNILYIEIPRMKIKISLLPGYVERTCITIIKKKN